MTCRQLAATFAVVAFVVGVSQPLRAHDVTYQGTVVTVEPARIQVKTAASKTQKEETLWFAVNKDTKIRRGEKTVTYAEAAIVKGERIVVIVDHDAETKMLATQIRLASKSASS
jgi:hypothetical protein